MITFLEAVGKMEGALKEGSRPFRNNNPGDIEWGKFAAAHGATHGDPRFAVFPDMETGYKAMKALFQAPSYAHLTVAEALRRWAPPNENNVNMYLDNVCAWTGCQPTDKISTLL